MAYNRGGDESDGESVYEGEGSVYDGDSVGERETDVEYDTDREEDIAPPEDRVSYIIALLLLMVGGFAGLHLVYLRRLRQSYLYCCTVGFLGIGVVRDLAHLRRYVKEANGEGFKTLTYGESPPLSEVRVAVCLAFSAFVCAIATLSVQFLSMDPTTLSVAGSAGAALGAWVVGSIGREVTSRSALAAMVSFQPMLWMLYEYLYQLNVWPSVGEYMWIEYALHPAVLPLMATYVATMMRSWRKAAVVPRRGHRARQHRSRCGTRFCYWLMFGALFAVMTIPAIVRISALEDRGAGMYSTEGIIRSEPIPRWLRASVMRHTHARARWPTLEALSELKELYDRISLDPHELYNALDIMIEEHHACGVRLGSDWIDVDLACKHASHQSPVGKVVYGVGPEWALKRLASRHVADLRE